MPSEKDEKIDAEAIAKVFDDIDQEYEMLLKEQPELMKPRVETPPQNKPNFFRRNRQRR